MNEHDGKKVDELLGELKILLPDSNIFVISKGEGKYSEIFEKAQPMRTNQYMVSDLDEEDKPYVWHKTACPRCGDVIYGGGDYCAKCGQRLDRRKEMR